MGEHLVGDIHIVLHRALHGMAQLEGRRQQGGAGFHRGHLAHGRSFALGSLALGGRRPGRALAGGDGGNPDIGVLAERRLARHRAIGRQQIGGDVGVLRFAQAGGRAGRHRGRDELVEVFGRACAEAGNEAPAPQRRRVAAPGQVGAVATGAIVGKDAAARCRLGRGENTCRRRLCPGKGAAKRHQRGRAHEEVARHDHFPSSQPWRFPSGAFSLSIRTYSACLPSAAI